MSAAPRAVPPAVNGWNAEYLDAEYTRYKQDPDSVPPDLRSFFAGFDLAQSGAGPARGSSEEADTLRFQARVGDLIEAYRSLGHIAARLDPFDRARERPDALNLETHGLSEGDLSREVDASRVGLEGVVTLGRLIEHLEARYCGTLGVEVMHITDRAEREWLLDRFERGVDRSPLTRGQKIHLLEQILSAEMFERFLQKRYPGDKRFSLEGSESLIPLLDRVVESAAEFGVEEIVLGMAHRGRLNVLNNILGKTHEQIFTEFEETWQEDFVDGGGDVKYHRGYSGTRQFGNGRMVHLAMASNPSHLEAVNPVVMGRCRAKQRLRDDRQRKRVMSLLIHGDAAIAGQGVVAECLNMSQLDGYTVGGTVHVVVNNLIGFTTTPEEGRSGRYCTDIANACECPVLHVNGEDPEAVLAAAYFSVAYRQVFGKDIFIELWCYRKYGHNEQDEASFTQPILAGLIKKKKSVLESYSKRLLDEGLLSKDDMEVIQQRLDEALDKAQKMARERPVDPTIDPGSARWSGMSHSYSHEPAQTAVSAEAIREVCEAIGRVPDGFKVNRKLVKLLEDRRNLLDSGEISYADAETLAYGTLLIEGHPVRVSGQDVGRGTFSHRHAVLRDADDGRSWVPLAHIRPRLIDPDLHEGGANTDPDKQAQFCIHNSPLSEEAVLGFEYGYSLADPSMLIIWEAQFGDFNNGAQIIIDQFITSAEMKWQRWNGLTLLLPHGYEGAGPEHSSARLERFLQLCGDDNIQVVYPTTAAQAFHMFRRQVKRNFRKPLIVMSPKSMLRTPTSHISELIESTFREVIDDPAFDGERIAPDRKKLDRKGVERVILCSGKIYHELAKRRDDVGRTDTAIVRIEQLYPLHTNLLREVLGRYPEKADLLWVQEEPRNMGAYLFIADKLAEGLGIGRLPYIGRPTSATPASGSKKRDRLQQEDILSRAIGQAPEHKAEEEPKPNEADGEGSANGKATAHKRAKATA